MYARLIFKSAVWVHSHCTFVLYLCSDCTIKCVVSQAQRGAAKTLCELCDNLAVQCWYAVYISFMCNI